MKIKHRIILVDLGHPTTDHILGLLRSLVNANSRVRCSSDPDPKDADVFILVSPSPDRISDLSDFLDRSARIIRKLSDSAVFAVDPFAPSHQLVNVLRDILRQKRISQTRDHIVAPVIEDQTEHQHHMSGYDISRIREVMCFLSPVQSIHWHRKLM